MIQWEEVGVGGALIGGFLMLQHLLLMLVVEQVLVLMFGDLIAQVLLKELWYWEVHQLL